MSQLSARLNFYNSKKSEFEQVLFNKGIGLDSDICLLLKNDNNSFVQACCCLKPLFILMELVSSGSRYQVSAEVQLGAATPADPSGTSRNS